VPEVEWMALVSETEVGILYVGIRLSQLLPWVGAVYMVFPLYHCVNEKNSAKMF
jgi:hypothetical protein